MKTALRMMTGFALSTVLSLTVLSFSGGAPTGSTVASGAVSTYSDIDWP
ncbi:hypothetical protein ACGFY9_29870 [Streptomyces sp. NPDC048504]